MAGHASTAEAPRYVGSAWRESIEAVDDMPMPSTEKKVLQPAMFRAEYDF